MHTLDELLEHGLGNEVPGASRVSSRASHFPDNCLAFVVCTITASKRRSRRATGDQSGRILFQAYRWIPSRLKKPQAVLGLSRR